MYLTLFGFIRSRGFGVRGPQSEQIFWNFPHAFQAEFQTSRFSRRYISTESERLNGFRRAMAYWKRISKGKRTNELILVSVEYLDLEKVKCWISDKLISTLTANTIKWKPFLINNFFILNAFEVKEFISRCFSKLLCSGDFENPGQLPVSEVLHGTVE